MADAQQAATPERTRGYYACMRWRNVDVDGPSGGMVSTAVTRDFPPRRGKARLRLGIPALLVTVNGQQEISLLDLSQSGARLSVRGAEPIGSCILKWMDYEAFGVVAWRAGHEMGLQFDAPIQSDWLLDTREWLPALAKGGDEIRRFARDWVRGGAAAKPRGQSFGRPNQASASRAKATLIAHDEIPTRRQAVIDWLRAGRPFIVGGVVVGVAAGYWSNFL